MPLRGDAFAKDHYYHIYNRGTGESRLFFSAENYEHCLRLVQRYRAKYGVTVIAYCFMPNHYHLLLRQDADEPMSRFISVVFNAYVQALNKEQNRKGTLFEGRFRHVWVNRDEYLTHLCRYIHLNPVKAGLVSEPHHWPYSNYAEWTEKRHGTLCDRSFIRQFFATAEDYRQFVADYQEEVLLQGQLAKYALD